MDFSDQLKALVARLPRQLEAVSTEEATKTALVMPFIQALGYNVFDPTEVVPEYTADVGIKKGEKVDYALMIDRKPTILIECKPHTADLSEAHASQLFRYFTVTEARFGVLTNGVVYRFYTDLDERNKMDSKPFLIVDLLSFKDSHVDDLKRFTKSAFDLEKTIHIAGELKYTRAIKQLMATQLADPTDDFVNFIAGHIHTGKRTRKVIEQLRPVTKRAFQQFINDRINERLQSALDQTKEEEEAEGAQPTAEGVDEAEATPERKSRIVTTEEEVEGFHIVRAIVSEVVAPARVSLRDTLGFCGVLLDDTNRKPICKMFFNNPEALRVQIYDAQNNDPQPIDSVAGLYKLATRLKAAVRGYEKGA